MYPDLNKFRRTVIPFFEKNEKRFFGHDLMLVKEAQDRSYVGIIKGKTVEEIVNELTHRASVFPTNLAALKYKEKDGDRVYERASYSYRPGGFFGKWQFHFRLFPHEKGAAVWAHHELNPWYNPKKHYGGHKWSPKKGAEKANEWFDISDIDF